MAIIRTDEEQGVDHLPAGWLSGLATLCGIFDDSTAVISAPHTGAVTCEVCRDMAKTIFHSVQPDEVDTDYPGPCDGK
ncbi:TPA: hypothetical protein ACVBYD_000642 [Yersinia enterocolitica]